MKPPSGGLGRLQDPWRQSHVGRGHLPPKDLPWDVGVLGCWGLLELRAIADSKCKPRGHGSLVGTVDLALLSFMAAHVCGVVQGVYESKKECRAQTGSCR